MAPRPDMNPQKQAVEKLQELRIPCSEREFFRHVRSGDVEIVKLMLAAGIRSSARDDSGDPAIVVAATRGRTDVVDCLIASGVPVADLVTALKHKTKQKDRWDKLGSISGVATVISGLLIAGIGGWFTYIYNSAQLRLTAQQSDRDSALKNADVLEKMLPYLSNDDENTKRAALLAVRSLTDVNLASQLAELYKGPGSMSALVELATAPAGRKDREIALQATAKLLEASRPSVVKVKGNGIGSGFIDDTGRILTADYFVFKDKSPRVLRDPSSITIETADGATLRPSRIELQGKVAVMQVVGTFADGLRISRSVPLSGQNIIAFGFREPSPDIVPEIGHVLKVSTDSIDARYSTAQTLHGSGGGPVISSKWEVVGIIYENEEGGMHEVARVRPQEP